MQTASSRLRTRVAVSSFNDNNHCTMKATFSFLNNIIDETMQLKRLKCRILASFALTKLPSWLELLNTPTASLQRGKTLNEYPGYDTKQSDGEVPVLLELWVMLSTSPLPTLPGPLWPGVVASDKGPIYGLSRTKSWFEVGFAFKLRIYA